MEVERVVRTLTGVRGVYNNIEVSPSEVKVENVRTAVAEALRRQAEIATQGIHISLREGVVSLSGRVHSWKINFRRSKLRSIADSRRTFAASCGAFTR